MQEMQAFLEVSTFLNARHFVTIAGRQGPVHPHSWRLQVEVGVPLEMLGDEGVGIGYADMERLLRRALAPYEGTLLNGNPPFDQFQPSTENLARVLFDRVAEEASAAGVQLVTLSLWEGPTKGVTLRRAPQLAPGVPVPAAVTRRGAGNWRLAGAIGAVAGVPETGAAPVGDAAAGAVAWSSAGAGAEEPAGPPAPAGGLAPPAPAAPPWVWWELALGLVAVLALAMATLSPGLGGWTPGWPLRQDDPVLWPLATALGAAGWLPLARHLGKGGALLAAATWTVLPLPWNALALGQLSRAAVLALVPWILLTFLGALENRRPLQALSVLFLLGLLAVFHPPGAVTLAVAFCACAVAARAAAGPGRGALAVALSLAMAAGAAVLWALPALLDDPVFAYGATPMLPARWLLGPGRYGTAPEEWLPWLLLVLAAVSAWGWSHLHPLLRGALVTGAAAAFLSLPRVAHAVAMTEWAGRLLKPDHLLPLGVACTVLAAGVALRGMAEGRLGFLPAASLVVLSALQGPLLGALAPAELPGTGPVGGRAALVEASFSGVGSVVITAAGTPAELAPGDGRVVPGGQATLKALRQAWEQGWYTFLVDRLAELGATDLLVPAPAAAGRLGQAAAAAGFQERSAGGNMTWLSRPARPGSLVTYRGLAVGTQAANWALVFPSVAIGSSPNIQDYTLAELRRYGTLILSGAEWYRSDQAEALLRQLAGYGIRVIVDLSSLEPGLLSRRPALLGAYGEPVALTAAPQLTGPGGETLRLTLPGDQRPWTSFGVHGLDEERYRLAYLGDRVAAVGARRLPEGPVWFVGLGIPRLAAETRDPGSIRILSELTGLNPEEPPRRRAVPVRRVAGAERNTVLQVEVPAEVAEAELVLPVGARPGLVADVDNLQVPAAQRHGLVRIPAVPNLRTVRLSAPAPLWWSEPAIISLGALAVAVLGWVGLVGRRRRRGHVPPEAGL